MSSRGFQTQSEFTRTNLGQQQPQIVAKTRNDLYRFMTRRSGRREESELSKVRRALLQLLQLAAEARPLVHQPALSNAHCQARCVWLFLLVLWVFVVWPDLSRQSIRECQDVRLKLSRFVVCVIA
jgi:hypothetical protein